MEENASPVNIINTTINKNVNEVKEYFAPKIHPINIKMNDSNIEQAVASIICPQIMDSLLIGAIINLLKLPFFFMI